MPLSHLSAILAETLDCMSFNCLMKNKWKHCRKCINSTTSLLVLNFSWFWMLSSTTAFHPQVKKQQQHKNNNIAKDCFVVLDFALTSWPGQEYTRRVHTLKSLSLQEFSWRILIRHSYMRVQYKAMQEKNIGTNVQSHRLKPPLSCQSIRCCKKGEKEVFSRKILYNYTGRLSSGSFSRRSYATESFVVLASGQQHEMPVNARTHLKRAYLLLHQWKHQGNI